MATGPVTNSFFQVRLGGSIATTTGGARMLVNNNLHLILSDSGNFANSVQLASLSGFTTGLSGFLQNELSAIGNGTPNPLYTTGNQVKTGNFSVIGAFNFSSGINTPVQYFGLSNYTLTSGNYMVIATGSPTNVTGIIPSSTAYSGNLFTLINNCSGPLQISGVIGPDTNPLLYQFDALSIYGTSGIWNYLKQTGNSNLVNAIISLSGYAGNTFATITNLTATGITLGAQITSLSGFVGNMSGALQTLVNNVITNLTATGITLLANINSLSGQVGVISGVLQGEINTLTTNLGLTGQNLLAIITGMSGQGNLNSVNFSVIVPTGSGALSINFPFVFATIPQVDPTFVISGSNPYSYGVYPNLVTTTGYLALFTDIVTESGNSVYTQAHI